MVDPYAQNKVETRVVSSQAMTHFHTFDLKILQAHTKNVI